MPWNPNSARKFTACKSVALSLSPDDLKMIDARAKELNVGRSPALRSLLRDARRAERTGAAGPPVVVAVPEAARPVPPPEGTATGRFSCIDPNVSNPPRSEYKLQGEQRPGKMLRPYEWRTNGGDPR